MPVARLVERPAVTPRRRGRSAALEHELAEIRRLLQQAAESGRVIELTLAADERDETVKLRYRGVARDLDYAIRFQTGHQRTYRNRRGNEQYEADLLHVFVTSREPAPRAQGTRRRRKATVA
jgi:hypothetical protein